MMAALRQRCSKQPAGQQATVACQHQLSDGSFTSRWVQGGAHWAASAQLQKTQLGTVSAARWQPAEAADISVRPAAQ